MAGNHNFKEETGEMQFDASGYLRVNVSAGGAGDGAILDGVSSSIKATVFDFTNSNPLAVVLRDTNGDYVSVGGGTQYTEDAVAAADPVGTTPVMTRRDSPTALVSLNLDVVSQQATNYGAAYVQVVTSAGAFVDTFGGGTQYADAAVRGTATGTLMMVDDGVNIQSALGDTSGRLFVNVAQINGVTPLMGTGIMGTGSHRVTIASDNDPLTVRQATAANLNATVVGTGTFATQSTVTNAGTFVVQENGAALTALQLIDDTVKVFGTDTYLEATTKGLTIGAVRRDANTTLVDTTNEVAPLQVNATGDLKVAQILPLPAGTNNIGDVDVLTVNGVAPAFGTGLRGATVQRVTIATDDSVPVTGTFWQATQPVSGTVSVTGVSTLAEQQTQTTALQLIDDPIATLGTATYLEGTTKGNIIGVVRRDADTTLVDLTNEVAPLQVDARGFLKVEVFSGAEAIPVTLTSTTITGSVAVTNAGTFAVQVDGAALTSLQLIDDAIYASDAALNKTMGIGAVFDDVATVAITENQAGYVRMSSRRALLVEGVASGTAINVLDTNSAAALTALQTIDNIVSGTGANISQLGGTAISMNTGVRDAGTQRVTIATNDSVPVTFTGSTDVATQTTLASLLTSSQLVDDVVFTAGTSLFTEATSKGALSLAVRRDANTSLVDTTNEMTPLQVNATGELKVAVIQALPAGSAIIGKTGIDQTTPGTTNLVALSAETTKVIGTVNQGTSPWVTSNATTSVVGNGAAATAQRVTIANDSTGILAGVTTVSTVSLNSDIRQATAANLNAQVVGSIAHDGIDSGNPVGIAYRAIAHGANPTAVAAADRTVGYANRAGIPFVMAGHPNVITREVTVLAADGAQTNAAFVTVAAGTKIVVTRCSVTASAANTVNVAVRIGFGTATLGAEALAGVNGIILAHPAVAAGSGVVEGNGSGILGIGADDEDIRYTCGSPTTGSIKIIISYYTIES